MGASTLVAFDLETTGLWPRHDRIVEIGAVRFEFGGEELGRFESLVNPGKPVSAGARAVHGLSDADLSGAPRASEVLPRFLEWLGPPGGSVLLAHNAIFDTEFLGRELGRAGIGMPEHMVIDTLCLARRLVPLASHQLDRLAEHFRLGVEGSHRALADSLRVKALWHVLERLGDLAVGSVGRVYPGSVYRIEDPGDREGDRLPAGCEWLVHAMDDGARLRIEYVGGTKGVVPREISPRRVERRGGQVYVVAVCHVDGFEKAFRLDRIQRWTRVEG